MATGTYTGDGAATQAIIGVGFQPTLVFIIKLVLNTANLDSPAKKTDQDGANAYVWQKTTAEWRYGADHIISLDADGFTVGDGTPLGVNTLNILNRAYNYVCFR